MHHLGHRPESGGRVGERLDRTLLEDIGDAGRHVVPLAAQSFGGGGGRLLTVVGEQNGPSGTDTACDREADAAGADDDDYFLRIPAHDSTFPLSLHGG